MKTESKNILTRENCKAELKRLSKSRLMQDSVVLAVLLLWLAGLVIPVDTDMLLGMLIGFACPTAAMATALSEKYDGDIENAVIYTLGTTVLSVITIPLLYWGLLALV